MIDPKAFGEQLGSLVKAAISKEVKDLELRFRNKVAELEQALEEIKSKTAPVAVKIASASIDADGRLILSMTDGTTIDAGVAKGEKGEKGDKGDPGLDAKGDKGDPGEDGKDGKDGIDGIDGKDGAGLSDAVIGKDGHLMLVFSDGRIKSLGVVVGKDGTNGDDGKPGEDGKDGQGVEDASIDNEGKLVLTFSNGQTKSVGVVVGKPGKDGDDGKPGADGLILEDLDIELVGDRTVKVFARRDGCSVEKTVTIPAMIYRGVYTPGKDYDLGDTVTFAGCMWTLWKSEDREHNSNLGKPGEDKAWQLSVKKGRDGRDFEVRDKPKGIKL